MTPSLRRVRRRSLLPMLILALALLPLAARPATGQRAVAEPNDPAYQSGGQWNIARIQAPAAWELLPATGDTVVAVIDTGLDFANTDFTGRISPWACDIFRGRCTEFNAPNRPDDDNGHGTWVAGIIGANTNNSRGIASVSAGRVTLLPIKVLSRGGGLGSAQSSKIAEAIVYAVDKGARVINFSLGFGGCYASAETVPGLRDAIAYADQRDVLIVASAGNTGYVCTGGSYPQNDPRVLAVASTDFDDRGAFSTESGPWVAVAAPGVNVVSLARTSTGATTVRGSGTSIAAPHVAGLAALLFQVPGATKAQVVDWLTRTCDPASVNVRCGGRINAYRAVHLAMKGSDPGRLGPAGAAPTATPPASATTTTPPSAPTEAPAPTAPDTLAPTEPPPSAPIVATPSALTAPANRPALPPLPTGFAASDATRAAAPPALAVGLASNVGWSGRFWPSAPSVPVAICLADDTAARLVAEATLARLTEQASVAGWRLTRDDSACAARDGVSGIVIEAEPGVTDSAPPRSVAHDLLGALCPPPGAGACWVGRATVTVNEAGATPLSEAAIAIVLRELVTTLGLGAATGCDSILAAADRCPAPDTAALGPDDVAALHELLLTQLRALR